MKSISFLLMSLLMSFSISSCFGSDDDDSHNNDDDNSGGGTTGVVVEGNWKVTLFQEDNSSQTYHFNGYSFDFGTDGTLVATNGSTVQNGNWNNGGDDSGNKLNINFPSAPDDSPFEEISEDWNIITKTVTKIELRHVSGGDGSVDLLTFEKL